MYAFTQDVPIGVDTYERIARGIGEEPPIGMILHLAVQRADGGLRYIDVWESEADWDRFATERLHPVVHEILAEVFGSDLPSEPERVRVEAVHAWLGALPR